MNRLDGKLKEEPEKASGERASEAQKKYCCDYRSYYIIMRHGIVHGIALKKSNDAYKVQEEELQTQIDAEKERSEEINKLKKYVGTDEYIEEVAREKLGLVKENEILFRAQQ